MAKKQVPDWLNSSLWSTNQPPSQPPPPLTDAPTPSDHSPVDRNPDAPVTPQTAIKPPEPVKVEVRDPLRDSVGIDHQNEIDNGVSSSSSSVEDVSKHAQLLQEVVFTVYV